MSKTITLRLDDKIYGIFQNLAQGENRTISNFIETSVLRYIEQNQYVDEFEMAEIQGNKVLNSSLKRALKDAASQRGRFVE
jgi:predicted transcriptional regulator